jgi:isochorismate synthase EntC
MSSFNNPRRLRHHFYLFAMKNGKKKLAYGASPEDAYEILRLRLSSEEMQDIIQEQYTRISQRKLRQHIHELG